MQDLKDIQQIFAQQQANRQNIKNTSAKQRISKLKSILQAIQQNRAEIQAAIYADFKKPFVETDMTEIFPIVSELRYLIKNLSSWISPKHVKTPLVFIGTTSKIYYEPKGTCLIISPWNYPFHLTFGPLIGAIAAGNTVIIKPSEFTLNTTACMKRMLQNIFADNEVAVIEGDSHIAENLTQFPFDHIFFTGSTAVGKRVMQAAAQNLTSVTLELGGKSPVIVDQSADIEDCAQKIVYGKFTNCGQTCIAPDYVLVHDSVKEKLVTSLKFHLAKMYAITERENTYARIINKHHFNRLRNLLKDAHTKGAAIVEGGLMNEEDCYIAPVLLVNAQNDMQVMQEEIFGPILPLIAYTHEDEVIEFIQNKPKPLALYIFARDKKMINFFIQYTTSGGMCINECLLHIANHHLPFGGVNQSGIGKSKGLYSFVAFSNERSCLKQRIGKTTAKLFYPPYKNWAKKLINILIKWF